MVGGFLIDGQVCPLVGFGEFTMDDCQVLFDYTGQRQEDYLQQDDETEQQHEDRVTDLRRNVGFDRTLMHVAYAHSNPSVPREDVARIVGGTRLLDAMSGLSLEEDDACPRS